ncbi:hypothetical protein CJF32_00011306 [Rutstroemia sp. NJR-2017a WRK4]|nr:hypothetical protein CJF32_00011306 [Rutstroemia sp. NJR-2017a WRK4]
MDDNNLQPAKRRKPLLSPLDDTLALSRKHNPKRLLRQRHSPVLPLTAQHKMSEGQSQNNCNHLPLFKKKQPSLYIPTLSKFLQYDQTTIIGQISRMASSRSSKMCYDRKRDDVQDHFTVGSCSRTSSCFYPFQYLGFRYRQCDN